MDPNKTLNMTMLCDFYELTMGNGYLDHNMQDRITYFDVFFRSVPDDGGYAIRRPRADHRLHSEPALHRRGHCLPARPEAVQ